MAAGGDWFVTGSCAGVAQIPAVEEEKVEEANEALIRAKAAGRGALQNAFIALAPILEGVARFANKVVAFLRPVFDWLGRAWVDALGALVLLGAALHLQREQNAQGE